MKKKDKISKNREYKKIYNRGKSMVSPVIITYILKNRFNSVRVGITTSKKIGNAVNRNRARRVIREAFRLLREKVNIGYDIVFVARTRTCIVKTEAVMKDMKYHLEKLGALK